METCKVLGFGHVGVQVQDLERSRRFSGELLGFEVVWEYAHTDYHMLFMGKNGCVVELMEGEGKLPDGALNHLSILVDDVEKGKAELEARGVSFETDILLDPDLYPRGEKFAMFRGPDNERLQLEQIL